MAWKMTFAPVLAGLLLAVATVGIPAAGADAAATPPAAANGPGFGPGGGMGGMGWGCGGVVRFLTPEQHAMHFREMHIDTGTMTVNAYRDFMRTQCTKFAAMTPADRKAYADGLQAKWDKLSDKDKLAAYHDMLAWRGMGMRSGRGMGRGPAKGMGGGWR